MSASIERMKTLNEMLNKASGTMSKVAASIVTPDKLIKIAVAAAQRTPLLLECSPQSIVRAVIQGAELGLTPGSALNHAYLVPFKSGQVYEAQLIVSAQGLTELMYRSGLITFVLAEVVYEGDDFEYELGLDPKLRHVPRDETINSELITHADMVVGLNNGSRVFRVLTRKAIDRIRAKSKAANNGPWVTDYAEMARKTVIKNGSKYVPKSIEVARAIALDNAAETGDFSEIEFDTLEALPSSVSVDESPTVSKVAGKVAEKAAGVAVIDPFPLAPFELTVSQVKELTELAKAKGVELDEVAAGCETKTFEALQEALKK